MTETVVQTFQRILSYCLSLENKMRYKLSPLASYLKFVSIRITSKRYTLKRLKYY